MKDRKIKTGKQKQNHIILLMLVVLSGGFVSGNFLYGYHYDYANNGQYLLSYNNNGIVTALSNSLLQHMSLLSTAQASVSNTSSSDNNNNTPVGANITTKDISNLASLFNDQPFQGGQVSPRIAKWVNNDIFIFLQFDKPNPSNATTINYVGIGKRGTFCEEDRPTPDFVHFHKWNATAYREGHGSKAGDEGYWLMWVATGEFDVQDRHVKPGVDREFFPTPPPPKCSTNNTGN
jgi:hypothetical protein